MRYFILFSYLGTNYHGYQIQPQSITVQEVLEDRLSKLLKDKIKITGAGRTDAGVHAKQMMAHFDYGQAINKIHLIKRLNRFLPYDIAVHDLLEVKINAHARFDAVKRTYQYQINLNKNPFAHGFGWDIFNKNLNVSAMNAAANYLLGTQDFSSFAKLNTDVKTHICTVDEAHWENKDETLIFTIAADRFLRNMVRAIVGTLVAVGEGVLSVEAFLNIIEKKERSAAGVSAPAEGLYLVNVEYPKEIYNDER